jgi:hypothetical protein
MSLLGALRLVRVAFASPSPAAACDNPHLHNREWCVVYLSDSWHRFCRRLVLTSAVLEPVTLSGVPVLRVPGLASEKDVLVRLRTMPGPARPPYWEPRWHDAVQASQAARFLSLSNSIQIVGALGSTPSPAVDLNAVRNFVAHRNRDTATRLRPVLVKYGVTPTAGTSSRDVVDQIVSSTVGKTTVFQVWCAQLEQIAFASVA